jgi:hypothetical protein
VTLLQKVAAVSSSGVLWVAGNSEQATVLVSAKCMDGAPEAAHLLRFRHTAMSWNVIDTPTK